MLVLVLLLMLLRGSACGRANTCLYYLSYLPVKRRLEATADEILKVSERPRLIAYNELLRWQLVLRKPYLDPVNVMQVSASLTLRAAFTVAVTRKPYRIIPHHTVTPRGVPKVEHVLSSIYISIRLDLCWYQ